MVADDHDADRERSGCVPVNARNGVKVCNRCRKPKPVAEYVLAKGNGRNPSARHGNCESCRMIVRMNDAVDESRAA